LEASVHAVIKSSLFLGLYLIEIISPGHSQNRHVQGNLPTVAPAINSNSTPSFFDHSVFAP
jgi:hypothetical protein